MMSTEPSYHLSLNFIYGMHIVHDYYLINNLSKTYPLNEYMNNSVKWSMLWSHFYQKSFKFFRYKHHMPP